MKGRGRSVSGGDDIRKGRHPTRPYGDEGQSPLCGVWGAPTFSLFSIAVGDKEKGIGENTLSTYENICVIIRSWLQQLLLLPFYSSCNH
jgi:hypothetical protein